MTPLPGIHHNVSFEDYQKWEAINFSRLKPIRKTASKCRWAMDHPKEPTPAMVLGSALHVATLEPARFDGMFYICPPCDRRTKEGREIFERAEQEARGRLIIRSGDDLLGQLEQVKGMAAAVHASRAAQPFISAPGQNEVSMIWLDQETGLLCKARVDRLIEHFAPWGCPVVVEIKSTRDAEDHSFGRDCHSMGYAGQAGCYCLGVKAVTGKMPAHVFIAVESEPPHDLNVHALDSQSLQTGILQYRQMLNRYQECAALDTWPGYLDEHGRPDTVHKLSLPPWAHDLKQTEAA